MSCTKALGCMLRKPIPHTSMVYSKVKLCMLACAFVEPCTVVHIHVCASYSYSYFYVILHSRYCHCTTVRATYMYGPGYNSRPLAEKWCLYVYGREKTTVDGRWMPYKMATVHSQVPLLEYRARSPATSTHNTCKCPQQDSYMCISIV